MCVAGWWVLAIQIDPRTYGSDNWGVLSALVFVVVVLTGLMARLVWQGGAQQQKQNQVIMDFVDRHRSEFSKNSQEISDQNREAMEKIATAVNSSAENVRRALDRQSRSLDTILMTEKAWEKAQRSRGSSALTAAEIDAIVRSVISEMSIKGGGSA